MQSAHILCFPLPLYTQCRDLNNVRYFQPGIEYTTSAFSCESQTVCINLSLMFTVAEFHQLHLELKSPALINK